MQIKLTIATVLLALTSSTLAILPPNPDTHYIRPIWSQPRPNDGRIRPAVCSSNPNSALYCGPHYAGSGYDKRAPIWAGPDGKDKGPGMIRPAVCSSNRNSPLYCPGVYYAYNHKRSPQFNIQVCTPDPSGQRNCLENYRSDPWRFTRPQQKRSQQFHAQVCTPDPTGQRRCLENRRRPFQLSDYLRNSNGPGFSPGLGKRSPIISPAVLQQTRETRRQRADRCRHLEGTREYFTCYHTSPLSTSVPVAKRSVAPMSVVYRPEWFLHPNRFRLAQPTKGPGKRHHYGIAKGKNGKNKQPRMMVCSFDKKSPNYCPGLEKDTEKIDERPKGGRKSFFA